MALCVNCDNKYLCSLNTSRLKFEAVNIFGLTTFVTYFILLLIDNNCLQCAVQVSMFVW